MKARSHRGAQFLEFGTNLAEQFIVEVKFEPETDRQRALLFFFSKAYKTYQAVKVLCESGFLEDARDLARGIYELRLQALYLGVPNSEIDQRAAKFFDHEIKTALGSMHILRELFPARKAELNDGTELIRQAAEKTGRLELFRTFLEDGTAAKKAIGRRWWSGSIKDLMKSLSEQGDWDYLKEYDVIYSMLSDYIHSGVRLFRQFSREDSFRPKQADYTLIAWSALDWVSQIIGLTADAFGSDFGKTVRASQEHAKRLLESSKTEL